MRFAWMTVFLVACGHHHGSTSADGNPGGDDATGGGDGSSGGGDGGTNPDAPVTPAGGTLDPGFGTGGIVVVSSAGAEHAYDLAIQPDGMIVVVGDAPGGMLVLRFRDDGTLDPTFGTQGQVVAAGASARANGVALQPDAKIVVAGENQTGASALARFASTGALDSTFGTGGISVPIQSAAGAGVLNDVAVRPDGKLVFCGEGLPATGTINSGVVGRTTASGALDTTYGTHGYSTLTAQKGGGFARLAIDSQGRAIAVGTVYYDFPSGNVHNWLLGRFTAGGALDASFQNGELLVGGNDSYAFDIAMQADDRPLAFGISANFDGDGPYDLAHRTLLDGSTDPSYGSFGTVQFGTVPFWYSEGYAIALQPDGASIAVGEGEPSQALQIEVGMSRLTTSGASDPAFGTSGALVFAVPGGDAHPRATAVAANGAIYVTGYATTPSGDRVFLARVR